MPSVAILALSTSLPSFINPASLFLPCKTSCIGETAAIKVSISSTLSLYILLSMLSWKTIISLPTNPALAPFKYSLTSSLAVSAPYFSVNCSNNSRGFLGINSPSTTWPFISTYSPLLWLKEYLAKSEYKSFNPDA